MSKGRGNKTIGDKGTGEDVVRYQCTQRIMRRCHREAMNRRFHYKKKTHLKTKLHQG